LQQKLVEKFSTFTFNFFIFQFIFDTQPTKDEEKLKKSRKINLNSCLIRENEKNCLTLMKPVLISTLNLCMSLNWKKILIFWHVAVQDVETCNPFKASLRYVRTNINIWNWIIHYPFRRRSHAQGECPKSEHFQIFIEPYRVSFEWMSKYLKMWILKVSNFHTHHSFRRTIMINFMRLIIFMSCAHHTLWCFLIWDIFTPVQKWVLLTRMSNTFRRRWTNKKYKKNFLMKKLQPKKRESVSCCHVRWWWLETFVLIIKKSLCRTNCNLFNFFFGYEHEDEMKNEMFILQNHRHQFFTLITSTPSKHFMKK
jgi:hypothetical protein